VNTPHLIERSRCAITGNSDLEPLHEVKRFPVFMGCVSSPASQDVVADMRWSISRSSGLIQLSSLIPLDVLYPESHGSGTVARLWDMHHKAFAKYLSHIAPRSVLEIGGAHGILSREYKPFGQIPWTILEPNPSPVEGCDARYIRGFFDDSFKLGESVDAVVHSHVFEHVYEPDQFMRHLSGYMEAGKNLIFSLPNLQRMLEKKYTNCINFEHTVFLTEPYIEYLLAKHGFRLVDKEYFLEDHSIFYSAVRDPSVAPIELQPNLYAQNRQIYEEYVGYHEVLIRDLNQKVQEAIAPVYMFGAHIFSQCLIVNGLATDKIVNILDNDPNKLGRRLYGTNLVVQSPKVLRDVANPIVILKAGIYNQEIKEDILANINSVVTFLE
jgi:hypothetical protein